MSETTTAWVLDEGPEDPRDAVAPARLRERTFQIPPLTEDEALLEPICGAWEGNYGHALERRPIDICRARGESAVVLGNCGVVRVLRPAASDDRIQAGTLCLLTGNAVPDRFGYMVKAHAYDAPGTMGILARRTKAHHKQLIPIQAGPGGVSVEQWAAFSLRYVTAWANWRVAYGAWRLQIPEALYPEGFPVWSWGGGVGFAELQLAHRVGARCALISSRASRLEMAANHGFTAVDRARFADLDFVPNRYRNDHAYKERYRAAVQYFLRLVREHTDGEGVSIFIDNIGAPVFRATVKALAREGVLATAGWKRGMELGYLRASQAIARQTFVHTHYASYAEAAEAVAYAVAEDWLPPPESIWETYSWDGVPELARDYLAGELESYWPIFHINPL